MLFHSLNIAGQSLSASSMGIQVAGQNMANADTPSYVREMLVLEASSTLKTGSKAIGSGVSVGGVIQMLDEYLEQRLNTSLSDGYNSQTQAKYYTQLESLLGELSDVDISSALDNFFNSIGDVLNHPESVSYRQMAVSEGAKLATDIRSVSSRLLEIRMSINQSVKTTGDEINRLTQQIASLNMSIAEIEAGRTPATQAVGLRDQRLAAVSQLSQLINVKITEDPKTGMISVACGSDLLVMDGIQRSVYTDYETDSYAQISLAVIRVSATNNKLGASSGTLAGLYEARDEIIGGYSKTLDEFAFQLVAGFNEMYTSGQGLTGYSELTSVVSVDNTSKPLNAAGLAFTPQNGALKILVQNTDTGIAATSEILVQLNGKNGMSLEDFAKSLDDIEGISAYINSFNQLEIKADASNVQFAFSDDTSGVLSALGVNTFFTGSDARTININDVLSSDAGKFAASSGGIGYDTNLAVKLAAIPETSTKALGGQSITAYYRTINNTVSTLSAKAQAISKGDAAYYSSLSAQRASISGVNLDEESINLLTFQRSYQASAKVVTVINEMFESLINM